MTRLHIFFSSVFNYLALKLLDRNLAGNNNKAFIFPLNLNIYKVCFLTLLNGIRKNHLKSFLKSFIRLLKCYTLQLLAV